MKNNIKKTGVILVIAIILVIGVVAAVSNNSNKNVNDENKKTITISVFNKENENIYKEKVNTDKQYLIEVLEENKGLDVKAEGSQYGKYITSIKGIEQGDNYYWSYYIDGQYAEVGVSSCEIESGKTYDFKIESINF